jgi:hypothetical protein
VGKQKVSTLVDCFQTHRKNCRRLLTTTVLVQPHETAFESFDPAAEGCSELWGISFLANDWGKLTPWQT